MIILQHMRHAVLVRDVSLFICWNAQLKFLGCQITKFTNLTSEIVLDYTESLTPRVILT